MENINAIFKVGYDGLPESATIPLYRQIINSIQDAIRYGRLKDGDRLPTEPELMKLFNVSRVTLRAAMKELEEDGSLVRLQGKGTFINAAPYRLIYNKYYGFPDACQVIGKTSQSRFVSRSMAVPEPRISLFFKIPTGKAIPCLKVLRYIDDVPALIETIYYKEDEHGLITRENCPIEDSVYRYLTKYTDCKKLGGKFDFEAALPSQEDIELLNLTDKNTPLLITTDWNYLLPDNTPLFVSQQKTNTNIVKYYWESVIDF